MNRLFPHVGILLVTAQLDIACTGGGANEGASQSDTDTSSGTNLDEASDTTEASSTESDATTESSTTSGTMDLPQEACEAVEFLSFRAVDVEYDTLRDQLVIAATMPNTLHLYDPITGDDVIHELPRTPTAVSVAPDALTVAIGHDALVSHLEIDAGVLDVLNISTDVFDVVLAGNGWVYGFPGSGQWVEIHGVEIATGTETLSMNGFVREQTRAKLHPGGVAIYGATNGLSPSDIERYDVAMGPPLVLYDSPYHGDYEMCGDLWISDDGGRIFTRCGNTFRASDNVNDDMLYTGSLDGLGLVRHLDHSQDVGLVAAIPEVTEGWGNEPGTMDDEVRLFDAEFLGFEASIPLPDVQTPGGCFPLHGRYVFFDSSSTMLHVIAQVDAESGALNDFVVLTLPLP